MEEQPGAPLITVLENITTAHRPTLERQRIRLELDVPAGLRVPHAREVEHILDTLIDNAVRFSQEGDVVRVSTSVEGETVRIAVSDTGPGLSREQVERFFRGASQPFPLETGGRPRLGLYLASEQARWLMMRPDLRTQPAQGAPVSSCSSRGARTCAAKRRQLARPMPEGDDVACHADPSAFIFRNSNVSELNS